MNKFIGILLLWVLVIMTGNSQDLVGAEYFIDQDPGIGNASSISIISGSSVDQSLSIMIPNLSEGLHTLGLRVRDINGLWSLYERKNFIVEKLSFSNLTAAEYFIDQDPGMGNASPISIASGSSVDQSLSIMIPSLSEGMHTLGLRVRDVNGLWSLYERKNFIIQKVDFSDIVEAEFFLDTDPGPGAGIPVTLTPGSQVDEDLFLMIPNNTTVGYHEMGIRVKDTHGKWSLYEYRDVKICPVIDPNELVQNSSCPLFADGSISLNPMDGNAPYTYQWSNGATTKDISGLLPGIYTVSITDEDTCTSVYNFEILSGDQTAPLIQVTGDVSIQHCQGVPYNDAGGTAEDNCDGNISGQIMVNNQVDVNTPGTYTITYDVTDLSGNAAVQKTRSVEVIVCDNLSCPNDLQVCITDAPFLLNGADPTGGSYSGPGVANDIFSPSVAGVGIHTIMYTLGAQSCDFEIEVQSCVLFTGAVWWKGNGTDGVKDVNLALTGDATDSDITPANGTFEVIANMGSNFELKPTSITAKNNNWSNGVTVGDATRISQHMSGNYLTSFYRKVSADVNKSYTISSTDATVIKQALLGNNTAINIIKNAGSWRYIPTTDYYPDPGAGAPHVLPNYPEKRVYTGASGTLSDQNFFGIKSGDVLDDGADPQQFGEGKTESGPYSIPPVVWLTRDRSLGAGEEFEIEFMVQNFRDLAAFQYALRFDPSALSWQGIQMAGSGLQMDVNGNFGLMEVNDGLIRVVYTQASGAELSDGTPVFRIKMKSLESGKKLSELLQLDPEVLRSLAYDSKLALGELRLEFLDEVSSTGDPDKAAVQLLQNRPNPFNHLTTIGFILPESMEAQLRIYDLGGRPIWQIKKQYPAGYQEERICLEESLSPGVYYYELRTDRSTQTRKMLFIRE